MDFIDILYNLFHQKYANEIDELESAVFIYVEELILAKNIDLTLPINYGDPKYNDVLKDLLQGIVSGLKSIKISPTLIDDVLLTPYSSFSTNFGYISYTDWISESFQPKIQKILFYELINYVVESSSSLNDLVEFGLLSHDFLSKIKKIFDNEPNFQLYLEWFFKSKSLFLQKIQREDEDYNSLFEFKEPEKDLQSLYMVYRICELLGIQNNINLMPLNSFLRENINLWAPQNPNISEKYPMTLYCGIYLGLSSSNTLPRKEIEEILKHLLVKVVNSFKNPVFEDTFLVSYILRSCNLMNFKLTQKLILGITRYDAASITYDILKSFSSARLNTIYQIFNDLNQYDSLSPEIRQNILNIINSRKQANLYFNYDLDFIASPEGIFSSINILNYENQLSTYPFIETLQFILKSIKENLIILDLGITGQLSEIYHGIQVIEKLNALPQDLFLPHLSEFLLQQKWNQKESNSTFSSTSAFQPSGVSNSFSPSNNLIESEDFDPFESSEEEYDPFEPGLNDNLVSDSQNSLSSLMKTQPESPDLKSPIQNVPTPIQQPLESTFSGSTNYVENKETYIPKRPLPTQFWDFFGDFPILNPDILEEMKINFNEITKERDEIFESLVELHQWIVVLKILNIKFPISKDVIISRTAKFKKDMGFGIEGSELADLKNTFYGLCIYSECNLLDQLNLYKIQQYLQNEASNLSESLILQNDYIFMSLRLLERNNLPMFDYTQLIPKILTMDVNVQTESYNNLIDMIHIVNAVKCISPNYDLSNFTADYMTSLQIALEDDGSVDKTPSKTAMVLINLHELNMQGSLEGKFIIKWLTYDSNFFGENVKTEPIGWENDPLGYKIELSMCYLTLVALTLIYPTIPPLNKSGVCPDCKTFFHIQPKFCNKCGHKF